MRRRKPSRPQAYSLIELMIAITFLCIAFFGYVALHARLLHSGQRLEERETIRSATSLVESINFARGLAGHEDAIDGAVFATDPYSPRTVYLTTDPGGRSQTWHDQMPEDFRSGLDETMLMRSVSYDKPWLYRWNRR